MALWWKNIFINSLWYVQVTFPDIPSQYSELHRNRLYLHFIIALFSFDCNVMGSCDNITFVYWNEPVPSFILHILKVLSCWENISVSTVYSRAMNHCYNFAAVRPFGKTTHFWQNRKSLTWLMHLLPVLSSVQDTILFWRYTWFDPSALAVRTTCESSTMCNSLVSPLILEIWEHNPFVQVTQKSIVTNPLGLQTSAKVVFCLFLNNDWFNRLEQHHTSLGEQNMTGYAVILGTWDKMCPANKLMSFDIYIKKKKKTAANWTVVFTLARILAAKSILKSLTHNNIRHALQGKWQKKLFQQIP